MVRTRLLIALVTALVVIGLVPSAGSAISQKRAHGAVAHSKPLVAVSAKALPKRNLNDKLVPKPKGLFIKGNVNPGWALKPVVIQKATCKTCAFKRVGTARTNSKGKWKFRLSAPRTGFWYWKGFVKKAGAYGKSPTNFIYKTWR